jgi:hypothetical protein
VDAVAANISGGLFMHLHLPHLFQLLRSLTVPAGLCALIISSGCGSSNWSASRQTPPSVADVAAGEIMGNSTIPPVLLFIGSGTSSGDVKAVKTILGNMKLGYATATSGQLNAMSESQLRAYKLFLMPGGDAVTIGSHLSRTATTNLHNAIVNDGLHYLGICAGAFFADNSTYNYLHLTGVLFNFYKNTHTQEAVEIAQPNGTKLDQYWQWGPELNGWGSVVGRYPNGTAAISEGKVGKAWVILSGVHPEAPESWRYGLHFTTPVSVDNAYAETLVTAALNGTSLPHF